MSPSEEHGRNDVPGNRLRIERDARQRFRDEAWKPLPGGGEIRELWDGTRIEIHPTAAGYRAAVCWLDHFKDDCDSRTFETCEEAREYAWTCYSVVLLWRSVSREPHPGATTKHP